MAAEPVAGQRKRQAPGLDRFSTADSSALGWAVPRGGLLSGLNSRRDDHGPRDLVKRSPDAHFVWKVTLLTPGATVWFVLPPPSSSSGANQSATEDHWTDRRSPRVPPPCREPLFSRRRNHSRGPSPSHRPPAGSNSAERSRAGQSVGLGRWFPRPPVRHLCPSTCVEATYAEALTRLGDFARAPTGPLPGARRAIIFRRFLCHAEKQPRSWPSACASRPVSPG